MREHQNQIAVLILAAGASSRMGQPKQLLPWGETTLLGHAIEQAKKVSTSVFVLLGAHRDAIEESISKQVTVIFNPDWERGMGSSIATGIKKLEQIKSFEAALIMLADQPLLDSTYLNELKTLFLDSKCKVATTNYEKNYGVPAIFHNSLFGELKKLNQDHGAKMLMKDMSSDLKSLHPKGKEMDIDTLKTYNQLVPNSGSRIN